MADQADNALFREIEDDLREDRAKKLWKAYGKHVLAVTVAIVIGVAGYQGWRSYDISTRTADGDRFAAALNLVAGDQLAEATNAFAGIAQDASDGYAMLARFQQAGLLIRDGATAEAVATYQSLSDDTGIPVVYRDLAVVLGALQELDLQGGSAASLVSRAAALNTADNPWRHSAREIAALAAMQNNDLTTARETLTKLANDPQTPRGMRDRAGEMLAIIGQ